MATLKNNKKSIAGITTAIAAIIASVFAMEGGFVNNPRDPGGATNHGVTENVARAHGYSGSMQALPKETAEQIYIKDYIEKPGFLPLIEISPAVGHKLVDAGVNVGPARPARWLQTSLNAVNRGGKDYPAISIDGQIGPGTVSAYRSLVRVRGPVQACQIVLKLLDAQQAQHYMSLTHLNTFTPGWVMNRIGNVKLEECNVS